MDMNIVVVSGRLTREPELKSLPSGTAVTDLGLAVNYSKKNDEGGYDDIPTFLEVSVFGRRGELIAEKGKKGDRVTVSGRLSWRQWEAQDGTKREKVSIVANNVEGELFFRPADEVAAEATEAEAAPSAAQDDEIPF